MCEIKSLFLFSFAIPFGFLMIRSLISVKSPSRAQTVLLLLGLQHGLNGSNLCFQVWCSLVRWCGDYLGYRQNLRGHLRFLAKSVHYSVLKFDRASQVVLTGTPIRGPLTGNPLSLISLLCVLCFHAFASPIFSAVIALIPSSYFSVW